MPGHATAQGCLQFVRCGFDPPMRHGRQSGSVAKFERTTANSIYCTEPRPHILWLPETLQQSPSGCPNQSEFEMAYLYLERAFDTG
jgi:hypothetical protein